MTPPIASHLVADCKKLCEESRTLREAAKVAVAESREALAHSLRIAQAIRERREGKLK
jgi:hypothetical protein